MTYSTIHTLPRHTLYNLNRYPVSIRRVEHRRQSSVRSADAKRRVVGRKLIITRDSNERTLRYYGEMIAFNHTPVMVEPYHRQGH